jgi:adenylate kinase family enzyme
LFRPHLHAFDRYNGRIELFTVLFLEEVGEGLTDQTDHISEKVRVLITFFRMTTSFRLEVIQRYKSEIEPDQVKELEDIINRMETEAQSRGDHNLDVLLECFKNNKNATNVITNMAKKWSSYRNVDRTGKLDITIKQKNADEIKRILDDLSIMNREFLEIVLTEMGKALMEI